MSSTPPLQLYSPFNYSLLATLPAVSLFWLTVAVLGVVIPCFCRKNPNRLTIQVSAVTLAVCFYSFWLIAFLAQLNPLVGPQINFGVAGHIRKVWRNSQIPMSLENTTYSRCFPSW